MTYTMSYTSCFKIRFAPGPVQVLRGQRGQVRLQPGPIHTNAAPSRSLRVPVQNKVAFAPDQLRPLLSPASTPISPSSACSSSPSSWEGARLSDFVVSRYHSPQSYAQGIGSRVIA